MRSCASEIAAVAIEETILRYIGFRIVTAFSRGTFPGPEASIAKLAMARLMQHGADVALRLGGPGADRRRARARDMGARVPRRALAPHRGGSDEIQRNIIGERVLGLPKEPAPQ